MSDIVERLRQGIKASKLNDWDFERTENDMDEAADEIEKLRAALREIAENPTGGVGCNPEGFVKKARAALEGK